MIIELLCIKTEEIKHQVLQWRRFLCRLQTWQCEIKSSLVRCAEGKIRPTAVGQPSNGRPTAVGRSDGRRKAVGWPSDSRRTDAKILDGRTEIFRSVGRKFFFGKMSRLQKKAENWSKHIFPKNV